MTFETGIDLSHNIELSDGTVNITNSPQNFTPGVELTHNIELTEGSFAVIGTVVVNTGIVISSGIDLSDGVVNITNPPQYFTTGAIIRVFARPKVPGDDSQIIALDDVTALEPTFYPESTGNPSEYIITTDEFVSDEANDLFLLFKGKL